MFRIPYRWLPRTVWPNLRSMWLDIRIGVRNLWRWIPIIWFDYDFDWDCLARIMEAKLRWMAKDAETWIVQSAPRNRRQMAVCAELLKRLREDEYFVQERARIGTGPRASKRAQARSEADKRYLGLLIGKYLNHWWE